LDALPEQARVIDWKEPLMARTTIRPCQKSGIEKEPVVKTTIALAEDWVLVREGVRALLEREPGFQIVDEAGDGLETLQLVKSLKPDVLVLDLMLPGLNGLEVTRRIRQESLPTRIVILTQHAQEAFVIEAFRNGALGYVLKELPSDELVKAIREVRAGRLYLSNNLAQIRIEDYLQKISAGSTGEQGTLTTRQQEIVQLVAEGKSSKEIGLRLGLSSRTVETHRANAMRVLGINKQTELVRYALTHLPVVNVPVSALAGKTGERSADRV
jgi:DNA-binding NarL/FixJ family response regulator